MIAATIAALTLLACSPPPIDDASSNVGKNLAEDVAQGNSQSSANTQALVSQPTDRLFAVVINGGGEPRINYFSHLEHIRRLLGTLAASEVEPHRIAIFSGDGADTGLDLATREGYRPPDFWMLPQQLRMQLRPPIEYVDSVIDGFTLRKATRAALRAWFSDEGSALTSGDTLLFYVTDHGNKNAADLTNNTITLWGETLSVEELRELLAMLDPGVRVVMLMSQCYSGSFANLIHAGDGEETPRGNVCGYFSATAERRAHGCYAEANRTEALGHSHRVFDALAERGRLADAGRDVMVTDDTPDVPHATTHFLLEQRLTAAAERGGHETTALIDVLLTEAWEDPLAWEPEIRLLDRVGQAFGFASPRLLSELDLRSKRLRALGKQISTYENLWQDTLETLRKQNLKAFRLAHPEWAPRLRADALKELDPSERRRELEELLDDWVRFTELDRESSRRLHALKPKLDAAKSAAYRSEVRLAVVLRMRTLLIEVAGRHYMKQYATPEERSEFIALAACEDLTFAKLPDAVVEARARTQPSFPTIEAEALLLEEIVPAWLGMSFRSPRKEERARHELPGGASVVLAVFPDSPASEAEMQAGDIVLGPTGSDFKKPKDVREWVMQGEIDRPVGLRLLRDGEELELTIQLARYPLELPKLAGPREIGSRAPPLDLEYLPGAPRKTLGRAHLVLFWATWCGPCKAAIPEVLAFARARNVEVVAITDETPETLRAFLDKRDKPFPKITAMDPKREHFQSYGVSGTPTFVLVDAGGSVRHYSTGYTRKKGLRIDGWDWNGEK